jgi:class 3 adenylate cyclase
MKTRKLSYALKWSFDFNHSVEKVWPLVSNTDRMNRSIGLSQVEYRSEPSAMGGSTRYGETKIAGFKLEWLESPYEWVLHKEFGVHRDYSRGPLKAMDISWKLEPTQKGCRIVQEVAFSPKSLVFSLVSYFQIKFLTRSSFLNAFKTIDDYLSKNRFTPFVLNQIDKPVGDSSLFKEVLKQFAEVNVNGDIANRITKLILESSQGDLVRIKPFALAKTWSMDRLEILTAFLRGTNRGILSLYWDLVCPRCQGAKERVTHLSSLKQSIHCDSCNIDFTAQFDKSVEVTFSVHPTIRKINVGEYCVGGPQNTPHFVSQVRVGPKEKTDLSFNLDEGVYRVRSLQAKGWHLLNVKKGSISKDLKVVFSGSPSEEDHTQCDVGRVSMTLVNQQDHEIVVTVNRVAWMEDICTAAFVTSLQEFRNRFASEVLDPSQEISVSRVAILFTDLKGSTKMYQNIGDAKAYKLVRDHFEILTRAITKNEGAIVKTLGDAIMASFSSPASALKAAFEIHRKIKEEKIFAEQSEIKIGIHTGSCFVISAEGKLDYFGTNVNIAARTNGQCEGGDIIITQYTMNDSEVQKLVQSSYISCEKVIRNLKGFDSNFILYQIKFLNPAIKSRAA